ncbi:MAG: thioredoxin family protein [Negativicutes bacterium]|jgi:small redox-active disulfide protein 2
MEIKVLGMGCKKCQDLLERVKSATVGRQDVSIEKIDAIQEIMKYKVMSTPALVVNGKVVVAGRIPSEKELADLLKVN